MGSGRWRRARTEILRRAALLLAALTVLLLPGHARADVSIAPSHDGYFGAWLGIGPISQAVGGSLDVSAALPKLGAALPGTGPWRILHTGDAAIDLAKDLHAGKQGGPFAVLGAVLELKQDFDGYLLVSADGGATVLLDGQSLWSRDSQRLRGASWDVVPFAAKAGRHTLLLKLHHRGEHWAVMVRMLDKQNLLPPRGVLVLPGASTQDAAQLASSMLSMDLKSGLSGSGYRPRVGLAYRRGMPLGAGTIATVSARAGTRPLFDVRLGELPLSERGVFPLLAELPELDRRSIEPSGQVARLRVTAHVGTAKIERPLVLAAQAPEAWLKGRTLEARIERDFPALRDASVTRSTLRWQIQRLENIGVGKTAAERIVLRATKRVVDLALLIESGKDPLAQPGIQSLAHASSGDGTLQSFRIHVPANFRPGAPERYPMTVLLHGFNGHPSTVLKAFIDRKTGKTPHPAVAGFLVAPAAHDNSFYRGAGEREVIDVLDFMLRTFPIDERRVSITGVSMGGTGAAQLGLRYAERFSAAAPLCGYHSYFIRRDTTGKPLRDWEKPLMHHWSPASFADSGRNLPLYVAHGTKDYPLENSRVLVRRVKELGYSIKDEWPDTGHAVWDKVYANAGLWPWLSRGTRPSEPARVTLKTDALRYGSQDWLHVTAMERPDRHAEIDARITSAHAIELTTSGALGWRLDRPSALSATEPVVVTVDRQPLTFAPGSTLEAQRQAGTWQAGPPKPQTALRKRAGLEGPIRDAFLGPVSFVYGSGDTATLRANREVAEAFAVGRDFSNVRYPVLADRELEPKAGASRTLFLVGTVADNSVLRRLQPGLPLGLDGTSVRVGAARFTGKELGTLFIHPNPEHPEHYVVVLTAVDVPALYRAVSLPKLLPDWVVYDERVADASTQQVLGGASLLSAGFFDAAWQLPAPAPSAVP